MFDFLSELNCCPAHGQHVASHEFHPFVQIGQLLKFIKFDKIKVVEIYSNFPSKYAALGWELCSCEVPEWFALSN